jgi:hypothetical protein
MRRWRTGSSSRTRNLHCKRRGEGRRRSQAASFAFALLGALLVGTGVWAGTNWVIGLGAGSSGEGQAANVANLTLTAVASPAATNLLYPGTAGDVVVSISNPNPYPVTITAVQLPTNTTYATGYTTSALSVTQAGCLAATPSTVTWALSTGSSGSSHTLTTPLVVGASGQSTTRWP